MKRRVLSEAENAAADDMALGYMRKQADNMEEAGHGRPTELQIAAAAAKVAESTKRVWRLQEGPVV